jgi:hypothetical protein
VVLPSADLRTGLAALAETRSTDLALRLTLLDLLLRPVGAAALRPVALFAAVSGLLVPGALRWPVLWLGLAALMGARVALDWPFADNHAYLLAYWCLAAGLALRAPQTCDVLAANARLLVGLAFAFAVLWKLGLSDDFADGTFFRVTLVLDPRFEWITTFVGGVSQEQLEGLRAALRPHGSRAFGGVELPPRVEWLAVCATAMTALLESAAAVAFLWPRAGRVAASRHALLLAFCVGTYALTPVPGFGWLLLAMGIAQCPQEKRALRLLYVGVFALLILYGALPGRGWPGGGPCPTGMPACDPAAWLPHSLLLSLR